MDTITAGLILFLAYFIRGISGFGSGLIAVPLLALILPLRFVVPLVLILDFSAALAMSGHDRDRVRWDEIRTLLPAASIGVVLGATLLLHLPKAPLLSTLGLFVLAFGIRSVLNVHGSQPIGRGWAIPAGLTGGLIGALFGTGGPPYVVYLTHRIADKSQLRATLSGLFMLDGGLRATVFLVTGILLQDRLLPALLGAAPVMAIGLALGHRAHLGLSQRQMLVLIGLLLIGSGISLIWKAWH